MARSIKDEEKANDGTTMLMETKVGQPNDAPDKLVQYSLPTDSHFKAFIAGLSGETLAEAYSDYCAGVRDRVRSDAYDAAKQESTWITVGKDKNGPIRKNLMDFPVDKFVAAFNYQWNGLSAKAALLDKTVDELDRGFGAWRAAAKKHSEDGKVTVGGDGTLAVA